MRAREKRKLQMLAAVLLAIVGLGVFCWAALVPIQVTYPSNSKIKPKLVAKTTLPLPLGMDSKLNQKRLQRPLDPIIVKPVPVKPPIIQSKPVVVARPKPTWPNISLDCIFWGNNTSLVILKINQQTHRCKVGDKVSECVIESIAKESVSVSYRGESKTVSLVKEKGLK